MVEVCPDTINLGGPDSVSHCDGFFFFAVLGFELRAVTLSHSTSPIFVKGFLR
jgi:hypothetical protein